MIWLKVWTTLKAIGGWLKKNWTVPLVGISVLIGVILGRKATEHPKDVGKDNKPTRPAGEGKAAADAASGAIHAVESGERRKADDEAAATRRDVERAGTISDEEARLEELARIGRETRDKRKGGGS